MMNPQILPYPIIGLATPEEGSGVVSRGGIDNSEETKKRIWKLAEERQIEDTPANRRLAYKIDGLARFIVNIKRFSILKDYTLTSNDDVKNEVILKEIETFVKRINLMHIFRQVFTPLQIEGEGHLQKQYDGKKSLASLAVLEYLSKHTNPTDVDDYYYYQSQMVSKKWRDPEEEETEALRVWFIDLEKKEEYTAIKYPADGVYSRDRIIEVLNNEAGESNMQPVVSYIFIKNFLLQMLPNLIEVVTNPGEEIIFDTVDKTGKPCVPTMPPEALKTSDAIKYAAETKIYNDWKTSLTELANRITIDRTKIRKTIHPDTIHEKVIESSSSMNSDMIKALVDVLDTQISYGMGFSVSLLNASGVELSTAHNIFAVVAVTMRGIQQQFKGIAESLIYEEFPGAEVAGIEFILDELNPEDELTAAERKKKYAETAEILYNMGADSNSLDTFVSRNIDENLEMLEPEPVSEEAEKAVAAMLEYRNLQTEEQEEEQ